jgi:hypothetical protein
MRANFYPLRIKPINNNPYRMPQNQLTQRAVFSVKHWIHGGFVYTCKVDIYENDPEQEQLSWQITEQVQRTSSYGSNYTGTITKTKLAKNLLPSIRKLTGDNDFLKGVLWFYSSQTAGLFGAYSIPIGFIICWRKLIKRISIITTKATARAFKKMSNWIDSQIENLNK